MSADEQNNANDGQSRLTVGLGDQAADLAELREIAKLAYRALDDAWRVLSTIDGDDSHEQYELGILAKRVQDVAISLFTVLRHATNAQGNKPPLQADD